jgi:hypothetical protein
VRRLAEGDRQTGDGVDWQVDAPREVVAAAGWDHAHGRRATIRPDAGCEEAVDHLLHGPVAAHRDDPVVPQVTGRSREALGVPRFARLQDLRLDSLFGEPGLDPRHQAVRPTTAGDRIHDEEGRLGSRHAPDSAPAVKAREASR